MSKYNSKSVEYNGIIFDSKLECDYFKLLEEQVVKGEIKSFSFHPTYILQEKFTKNGKLTRPIIYEADFVIQTLEDKVIAIDIKGFPTPLSVLKRKLFDYRYSDIELKWITFVKKYGGWIEIEELKKLRNKNKKEK